MRIVKFFTALYLSITLLCIVNPSEGKAQGRISFQTFYDELEPYGRWYDDPQYGNVWSPDVARDFQPYSTDGHWIVTEYGNTWVSDYNWGWAPFHYGRWEFNDYNGWFWIPDYEWAPAWVAWRSGRGYYGWAPLGYGMHINININIPVRRWIFVPERYIMHSRVYDYCVRRPQIVHIYRHTGYIDNYYDRVRGRYVCGPRVYDLERSTRNRVIVHRVYDDNRPGRTRVDDRTVRIYRPEVGRDENQRSRPSRETSIRNRDENYWDKDERSARSRTSLDNNGDVITSRPSRNNEGNRAEDNKTGRISTRQEPATSNPNVEPRRPARNDRENRDRERNNERILEQPRESRLPASNSQAPSPRESRRPERQAEPVEVRERQETRPQERQQPRDEQSPRSESGGRPRR